MNVRIKTSFETGSETPMFGEYDIVVVGDGPAGIAAASTAALAIDADVRWRKLEPKAISGTPGSRRSRYLGHLA